jgi:hypothetical protein
MIAAKILLPALGPGYFSKSFISDTSVLMLGESRFSVTSVVETDF